MKDFAVKVPLKVEEVKQSIRNNKGKFLLTENYAPMIIRHQIWYRNDFAPVLYLEFKNLGNETMIIGKFRMMPLARLFMWIWFLLLSIVTLIAVFSIFGDIKTGQRTFADLKFLIIPIGMFFAGFGLIKFGSFIGKKNTEKIADWFFNLFPNSPSAVNKK